MVGQCLRFSPPYEFLRRCISDNRYGKLLYLDFFRHGRKPNWSVGSWLTDPAISGGVIRDLQIHNTDMVLNVLGMPKAIYSSGDATVCRTVYKFENSNVSVTASASFRNATFYIPSVGYDAVFENAVLTLQNNAFTLSTNDRLEENPLEKEFFPSFIDKNTDNCVKAEILYLCECLRDNKKPEMCLPEDSYKTMLISDAELESLNTKKQVELL